MEQNFIKIVFNKLTTKALLDTGASISCISYPFLNSIQNHPTLQPSTIQTVKGVGGETHKVIGMASLPFTVSNHRFCFNFYVFQHLHHHLILGNDFLTNHKACIDHGSKTVTLYDPDLTISYFHSPTKSGLIRLLHDYEIPANSEALVPVCISHSRHSQVMLLEPTPPTVSTPVFGARVLVTTTNSKATCRLLNPTDGPIRLQARKILGVAYPVDVRSVSPLESPSVSMATVSDPLTHPLPKPAAVLQELGIDLTNSTLTPDQQEEMAALIAEYRDVFALNMNELGCTDAVLHKIDTGDAPPQRKTFYCTSSAMRKELDKQIQELLENDIIEESDSIWSAPTVLVKKPGINNFRLTIDYRQLNKITKPINFPLPRLETVFDFLGNVQPSYFTTLDIRQAYFQQKLDPETSHKSTFCTPSGAYKFKRLPMGLRNSPASYQMLMSKMLHGLTFNICAAYLDDILIVSRQFSCHKQHIQQVFDRLRQFNLKLHPQKCMFARQEVLFLGHVLSPQGIAVNPAKLSAVSSNPPPRNQKQVRSFLGLASFYKKFVKGVSTIAAPLHSLLQKDRPFIWSEDCDKAFQLLKTALLTPPILR